MSDAGRRRLVGLTLAAVVWAGCTGPVRVKEVDPLKGSQSVPGRALVAGELSESTLQTLRLGDAAFDDRFQLMREVYAGAVAAYLAHLKETGRGFGDHERATLLETFRVEVLTGPRSLDPARCRDLLVARQLEVRGLRNRYERGGFGVPLVSVVDNLQRSAEDAFVPPKGVAGPVTAVLSFGWSPSTVEMEARMSRQATLAFYDPREVEFLGLEGYAVPHRGSASAASLMGRVGSTMVDMPEEMSERVKRLVAANPGRLTPAMQDVLSHCVPESMRALRPDHPRLLALAELPVDPDIPFNTIVGDRGRPEAEVVTPEPEIAPEVDVEPIPAARKGKAQPELAGLEVDPGPADPAGLGGVAGGESLVGEATDLRRGDACVAQRQADRGHERQRIGAAQLDANLRVTGHTAVLRR